MELGKEGEILDAKDALDQGPILLITNPALSENNPNNPNHTAGTTFMGQFMDHDMTFDLTSRLGVPPPPEESVNTRTPALDLLSAGKRSSISAQPLQTAQAISLPQSARTRR